MNDFTDAQNAPVAPPSDSPASSPTPGMSRVELANDPAVNSGRQTTLVQLAKDEKIDGYVAERTDQSDVFDKGREISDDRKAAWLMVTQSR
jgi:type II secretory pathway component PulC